MQEQRCAVRMLYSSQSKVRYPLEEGRPSTWPVAVDVVHSEDDAGYCCMEDSHRVSNVDVSCLVLSQKLLSRSKFSNFHLNCLI